jgi:hypothetical protein
MRFITSILFLSILLLSCNKEKRFSKKLMKGETWKIVSLTVDGDYYSPYGTWLVTQDVNIYDSVPSVQWSSNGQNATFQWQFQDKGKTFEISYKDPTCINCSTPPEDLDFQCYYLSGKYEVDLHKKDRMRFVSSNTIGFPGKKVEISIDKK